MIAANQGPGYWASGWSVSRYKAVRKTFTKDWVTYLHKAFTELTRSIPPIKLNVITRWTVSPLCTRTTKPRYVRIRKSRSRIATGGRETLPHLVIFARPFGNINNVISESIDVTLKLFYSSTTTSIWCWKTSMRLANTDLENEEASTEAFLIGCSNSVTIILRMISRGCVRVKYW